jgi:hypothetical protein
MPHVFVSHVHENEGEVQRLCDKLTQHGVEVWLDRDDIEPGTRWQQAIRTAIQKGAFFIACFSEEYNERDESYMNEELTLAIEKLRKISTDRTWFIPVKLNKCDIPDRDIGAGETLKHLQHVELYRDFDTGIRRILETIQPIPAEVRECYFLGFTIAKISWFHGNPIQLLGLKVQYNRFSSRLSIDQKLSEGILDSFSPTSNLGDVLKNAQKGIEARNTLSIEFLAQFGEQSASAFRFGFNLVNLMPQLEFVEVAQEKGDTEAPLVQLLGTMEDQFNNLCADAEILRLPDKHLSILRQAHSRVSQGQTTVVRTDLLEVGSAVEREMKM